MLEQEPKVPEGRIKNEIYKEFKKPKCLFPKAHHKSCTKNVISAHSIQKSKVLGRLKNSKNHVMTFYQSKDKKPKLIGWNKASTFNGFCKIHDELIFKEIEDKEIEPTEKQIFILSYRSFCHEFFQKSAAIRVIPRLINDCQKGFTLLEQQQKIEYLKNIELGVKKGHSEFKHIKINILDKAIIDENYQDFGSCYIEIKGENILAACGAISPDFDVSGRKIQSIINLQQTYEHMSISLINERNKIIFIMFWPKSYTKIANFVNSLCELTHQEIIKNIFAMTLGYLENVYFSEKWWLSLSDQQKKEISILATYIFYGEKNPRLSFMPANWQILKIEKNNF